MAFCTFFHLLQTAGCCIHKSPVFLSAEGSRLRLLNRSITAYVVENGTLSEGKLFSGEKESTEDFLTQEEQQAARWTYENRQRAGASTQYFSLFLWHFVHSPLQVHIHLLQTAG